MVEVDFEMVQPRGRRVWRAVKWPGIIILLLLFWCFGISWTLVVETCEACRHDTLAYQYRVLNVPVSQTTSETPTPLEFILRDLGRPCTHQNTDTIVWCRHWGAVWCPNGCHLRLTGGIPDYDDVWRPKVLEHAKEHPEAAGEIWEMVNRRDRAAIRAFFDRIMPGRL